MYDYTNREVLKQVTDHCLDWLMDYDSKFKYLKNLDPNINQNRYESVREHLSYQLALTYDDGSKKADNLIHEQQMYGDNKKDLSTSPSVGDVTCKLE